MIAGVSTAITIIFSEGTQNKAANEIWRKLTPFIHGATN